MLSKRGKRKRGKIKLLNIQSCSQVRHQVIPVVSTLKAVGMEVDMIRPMAAKMAESKVAMLDVQEEVVENISSMINSTREADKKSHTKATRMKAAPTVLVNSRRVAARESTTSSRMKRSQSSILRH
jgi:hypothetical protein